MKVFPLFLPLELSHALQFLILVRSHLFNVTTGSNQPKQLCWSSQTVNEELSTTLPDSPCALSDLRRGYVCSNKISCGIVNELVLTSFGTGLELSLRPVKMNGHKSLVSCEANDLVNALYILVRSNFTCRGKIWTLKDRGKGRKLRKRGSILRQQRVASPSVRIAMVAAQMIRSVQRTRLHDEFSWQGFGLTRSIGVGEREKEGKETSERDKPGWTGAREKRERQLKSATKKVIPLVEEDVWSFDQGVRLTSQWED